MAEAATCGLCGSAGSVLVRQSAWSVYRCRDCGLGFVHPIPQEPQLAALYPGDYYAHVAPRGPQRSLRDDLKRLVASEAHGVALEHGFARWPRWARRAAAHLLRGQVRIEPPGPDERRVLDVGCGNGEYLLWLRELGWECHGNELSAAAVAQARRVGLDVVRGDLQDTSFPDAYFDVVNMSSTLDHTADPFANAREAYRVLRPGGRLVAHSPNFESLQSRWFRARWYNFIPPEHLHFFSRQTFRAVFERAGFQVERVWTQSPPNFLSHTLMYKTAARPFFLRLRDRFGLDLEWSWPVRLLFLPLARAEDLLGCGEVVYLRGRKPG